MPVERLGDIHVTSQYIWGGRRNFTERPLRVLVAVGAHPDRLSYLTLVAGLWHRDGSAILWTPIRRILTELDHCMYGHLTSLAGHCAGPHKGICETF